VTETDLQSLRDIAEQLALARHLVDRARTELQAARAELARLCTLRPIAELHEDDGDVLLWRASVPVTVGSVLDEDFMDTVDYREITHWSQLPLPQLEAYTWDLEEAGI
jgi:hypothetical protein